jgi:hypothetical protein
MKRETSDAQAWLWIWCGEGVRVSGLVPAVPCVIDGVVDVSHVFRRVSRTSQLSIVFPMLWWEWRACFSAIDGVTVSGVVGVCWELEDSSGGFTPPEARVCFSKEAPR